MTHDALIPDDEAIPATPAKLIDVYDVITPESTKVTHKDNSLDQIQKATVEVGLSIPKRKSEGPISF